MNTLLLSLLVLSIAIVQIYSVPLPIKDALSGNVQKREAAWISNPNAVNNFVNRQETNRLPACSWSGILSWVTFGQFGEGFQSCYWH